MNWTQISELRLRHAPRPFKALALGYLAALSIAYVYAIGNVILVVGLSPKEIAIHYYGSDVAIIELAPTSGEEELNLDAPTAEAPATPVHRPSFKNLVAEGHFHLFGMASFFFGLCVLGLFTSASDKAKTWLVGVPFFAVIVDNLSFMITRFGGPQFAHLTGAAGTLLGLSFTALWIFILRELFAKSEIQS